MWRHAAGMRLAASDKRDRDEIKWGRVAGSCDLRQRAGAASTQDVLGIGRGAGSRIGLRLVVPAGIVAG